MTTKDEALRIALEALGELRKNPALKYEHIFVDTVTAAIKQAQDGALIDEGTKPQAITPETGNAANPEASAITAGNGQQAQEPVAVVDSEMVGGIGWTSAGENLVDGQELFAGPAPKQAEPASCRIELVVAIHTLASHYENRLHRLDPEDRKLAEGDIAHAMKIAAKWNWNGTSPTPPEAA